MKNNEQTFLIETDKKLCKYDGISYEIYEGQVLVIIEEVSETVFIAKISTNNEHETLDKSYCEGVKCFKLYNVMGGAKGEYCTNDTNEVILLKIKEFNGKL